MAHEYVKISELDPASGFNTNDLFVIVQNDQTLKINGGDLINSLATVANFATRSFVTAIVDSAPETLDTLKELAAALNDDANFASTITTLIGTKLDTSNFGLKFWDELTQVNTYHIAEGSNLYFTEQRVLDVVIPLVPTSIFDLDVPEVSVNLPGYLHYNGTTLSWESSTNPTYDTVTILAEPTSDSHAATKGYVDSQFNSFESFSGSYNDLTDKPTIPTDINQLADSNNLLGQGGGSYPTAPTFTTVTATQLNVQNVDFTGTGAVTIESGNDLNFAAAGDIRFNGEQLSTVATSGSYSDLTGTPYVPGRKTLPPTTSIGSLGDKAGDWAIDESYLYYCHSDYSVELTTINIVVDNRTSASGLRKESGITSADFQGWILMLDPTVGQWKFSFPGTMTGGNGQPVVVQNIPVLGVTLTHQSNGNLNDKRIIISFDQNLVNNLPNFNSNYQLLWNKECVLTGRASVWRRIALYVSASNW